MKQFACGDVVPGCTRTFQGSEDQILHEVADHDQQDHGMIEIPHSLVDQVRGSMTSA